GSWLDRATRRGPRLDRGRAPGADRDRGLKIDDRAARRGYGIALVTFGLGEVVRRGRSETTACRLGGAAALFATLLVAACTASSSAVGPQATASLPAKTADAATSAEVLREHQRILAAYGGVYTDPRLQPLIERTVERLVAASERPELHYT